jgi:hypothetical protein
MRDRCTDTRSKGTQHQGDHAAVLMGLCGCVQANADACTYPCSNRHTCHYGGCRSNHPDFLHSSTAKLSAPHGSTGICRLVRINGKRVRRHTHQVTMILSSALDFYRDCGVGRKCLHPNPIPGTTLGKTGLTGQRESQRRCCDARTPQVRSRHVHLSSPSITSQNSDPNDSAVHLEAIQRRVTLLHAARQRQCASAQFKIAQKPIANESLRAAGKLMGHRRASTLARLWQVLQVCCTEHSAIPLFSVKPRRSPLRSRREPNIYS